MRASIRFRNEEGPAGPRGLLLPVHGTGFPLAYLLSRLRGRRSRLIADWRPLVHGSPSDYLSSAQYQGFVRERSLDGLWTSLQQEYRWVFEQLDEPLRRMLAPYFLYAELRTVTVCLRMSESGTADDVRAALASSLLAPVVCAALMAGETAEAVQRIEVLFRGVAPACRGMASAYADKGLREVERILVAGYLAAMAGRPLHPVLRELFVRIIDARNILTFAAALRQGSRGVPEFIPGGAVAVERLRSLADRGDPFAVTGLVRQTAGILVNAPEASQAEVALYRGISKELRKAGRDPLGVGLIVDYLWRCSLEVTNLGILFAGRDLERQAVSEELIH
jgi:vacuolar-type H+-ATPase subunit C/Vma6